MTMEFDKKHMFRLFPKSLYKDAVVSIKGRCTSKGDTPPKIRIEWKLKYSQCGGRFIGIKEVVYPRIWDIERNHEIVGFDTVDCKPHMILTDFSSAEEYIELPTNSTVAPTIPEKVKKSKGAITADEDQKSEKPVSASKTKPKKIVKQKSKTTGKVRRKRQPNLEEILKRIQRSVREDIANDYSSSRTLVRVKRDDISDDDDDDDDSKGKIAKGVPVAHKEVKESEKSEKSEKTKDVAPKKAEPQTAQKVKKNPQAKGVPVAHKEDKEPEKSEKSEKTKDVAPKKAEQQTAQKVKKNPQAKNSNRVAVAKRDGIYLLIVKAHSVEEEVDFTLELEVSMESASGYLSATDWPLLPFYGIMSLVYLFCGLVWLIVSACQWRDLLRIQFWIGGVIALGMLEKAVFYSEYNNINHTGVPTSSLVVFAELVSVLKRTLARMLVIIVSMGFGIVKPRLGRSLHRVLGVGALYFILGTVEGSFRSLSHKADPSKQQLIASLPLAVLDAAICWWIFMSLVQTTRTLRIRRNVIKLSLYRHFTNTLIFAVLASVAYMIWSIKTHRFADCITDWSQLWLDEAFWHFLFSIILMVIMVLWRPTANNQRYAFTPLVDFGDDEDEDNITLSEAFEGMKNRNQKGTTTDVYVNGDPRKKADDDLKWVEENIPTSAADTVLPSVLDSDEELMTTKFEMSKME